MNKQKPLNGYVVRSNDYDKLRAEIKVLHTENAALRAALLDLYNMVNYALDARDALLISRSCATMDKARAALKGTE